MRFNSLTMLVFPLTMACAKSTADVGDTTKAVVHETMTAAQHTAMHSAESSLTDSAYAELQKRGAIVMGVDQHQSAHKFDVTLDGGRIELQRIENDTRDIAQIRSHMKDIQKSFLAGDFAKPFAVHDREMPGTGVMTKKKSAIEYVYADLPRGAELRLVTTDSEAKTAIAAFMQAQRSEHRSAGSSPSSH